MGALVRNPFKKKPAKWQIRYAREDGEFREITVVAFTEADAHEIASRRFSEQYGEALFASELRKQEADPTYVDPAAERVRGNEGLHHDNYSLVSVKKF